MIVSAAVGGYAAADPAATPSADPTAEPTGSPGSPDATETETSDEPSDEPSETDEPSASETAEPEAEEPESPEAPKTPELGPRRVQTSTIPAQITSPSGSTTGNGQNFYAYLGAGENFDVRIVKSSNDGPTDNIPVNVKGPGGVSQTCTIGGNTPAGTACDMQSLTSATPGVWKAEVVGPPCCGTYIDSYTWTVRVQNGTTDLPGRVWTDRHSMSQTGNGITFSIWYRSEQGFDYKVDYRTYQGIISIISSSAIGAAKRNTCESAYRSYDTDNMTSTTTAYYVPFDECGAPYHLFFEAPDAAMPATATAWDGSTAWVDPEIVLPTLGNLEYDQGAGANTRSGDFTVDIGSFVGNAELQIDVNNDGDYTDAVDRAVPFAVTTDGQQTIAFDGDDGQGNPISVFTDIHARAIIDQVGEIHFPNWDVETRTGGLEVTALDGPSQGSKTLYWNDTNLSTTGRGCPPTAAQRDGRNGVNSTGGKHGWCGTANQWGNMRLIDDWTYQVANIQDDLAIEADATSCEQVYALRGSSPFDVYQVDTTSGQMVSVGQVAAGSASNTNNNGMGISADARYVFTHRIDKVYKFDTQTGDTESFAGVDGLNATHGAVNPANGVYYYGNVSDDNDEATVYAFNTQTDTALGEVATISFSEDSPAGNGDWAFDRQGNLYLTAGSTSSNKLYVVSQALPTTDVTPVQVDGALLNTIGTSQAINGLAFGADGFLYLASQPRIFRVNPSTGDADPAVSLSPSNTSVDLASCASPSTITARKDVVGRFNPTDQFRLEVTHEDITTNNTGTTAGTDTGIQDGDAETAGPLLGLPGQQYTVTETGVGGTALANYTKAWKCEDTSPGGGIVAQGTGASGSFTMPPSASGIGAGVICTFTNTPIPPPGDSGDAPDSYGTLNAGSGARHSVPNYNGTTNTAPLMLGAKIDVEDDGAPGVNATGDDAAGIDDEDGVVFNTDVSVPGRLETVFVTTTGSGFLNGWIDFNRDGDFDAGVERVFSDQAVNNGVNRLTYTVPDEPDFVGGETFARFRLSGSAGQVTTPTGQAPNGEVEDYTRTLFDAEQEALDQCPRGSTPVPIGIIQNASLEDWEQTFNNNTSANTINHAEHWFDNHSTGGQYYVFSPTFDSGPAASVMPFRAGADGYGFLGTHTASPDLGEGATNTLAQAMVPGAAYVGFFSTGAGGHSRNGSGYMRMFGTSNVNAGSLNATQLTAANSEAMFDTPVVSPATAGARSQWQLSTFELRPTEAWDYLRVEARNATPANNGTTAGQTWVTFDDFHLFLCDPIRDFGDAPATYGTMLGNDAAFHDVPDFDDVGAKAPLMLGAKIDIEDDGLEGTGADGDDADATDDEDGVTDPISGIVGEAPTVSVSVTNDTGDPATLAGWVDLNANGTFEPAERVTRSIAAGSGTADYDLTFPTASVIGDTYARFRLFPGTVDPSPKGLAEAGEVEDYPVTIEPPVVTCATDSAMFNTAYDGAGGKAVPGGRDRNWESGLGNASGPASVASYIPAHVVTRHPAWYQGTFGNASWISHFATTLHAGNADLYFRYRFRIDPTVTLDGFALPMSFYADNSVPEVWVNGVAQSPFQDGLPQSASTYGYAGFVNGAEAATVLSDGFQHGANEIIVRVASGPDAAGFMAQIQPNPLCNDWGDAPNSYGTDVAASGASHGVADAATAALLMGNAVDAEPEGRPGPAADGDDTDGVDDEDGVSAPIVVGSSGPTTVTVSVTNDTLQPATLAGWIDLDDDGAFEPGERVRRDIDPVAGTADYALTFPPATAIGDAYARFRLIPGNIVDPAPTGAVDGGEVEDYPAEVGTRIDFGDAPNTYGTTSAANGPVHSLPGYVGASSTAPVMLGDSVDAETDGQPTVGADGDGTDEDGVLFNPALGYPNATIRTGTDPVTLAPVTNTVTVDASDDGFVSAWVDWNLDGDFSDAGERVANAQPVTAGDNDITFSQGTNPADIRTYVRVRYSTDAGSIAEPTGPAPDGEVEDYRVLLERLITPAACAPVSEPFYAMTFLSATGQTGTGGVGSTTRYPDITVVEGRPVDMVTKVITGGTRGWPVNGMGQSGDDAAWNIPGAGTTLDYYFYEAGTTTPIDVNGIWNVNDMDRTERTRWVPPSDIAGYAITPGSEVQVVTSDTRWLDFRGTRSGSGSDWSRYQVWFTGRSELDAIWSGFQNSGFGIDGDNDIEVTPSCADYGDAPDTYATKHETNGPRHSVDTDLRMGAEVEFDGNGQPTTEADGDDLNRVDDEDGVTDAVVMTAGEPTTVRVTATNNTGDAATLAGWLDLDGDDTFDVNERVIIPVAAGTSEYPVVFPPGPSTTTTAYARFRLYPGTVTDAAPTGPATAGEVEDYPVQVLGRSLEVTKTSDATVDSRPGDTVTYTLTAENTGAGDFSAANPARVVDDLTGVLDDADYNDDAAADFGDDPTYAAPRLSWSGALPAGGAVTITYSVTLKGGGDGAVRNVAWAPDPGDPPGPTPDCDDPATTVPCVEEQFDLPKLSIAKTSNRSDLPAFGEDLTYTVTVKNEGPGDYTASDPATFGDDLSEVLDDADFVAGSITASTGNASFTSPELSWTGVLAAGESATITYRLTYDGGGDKQLDNAACISEDEALDPARDCITVRVPGSGLQQTKVSDPPSGTPVDAGDEITYTLTFTNTGPAPATVNTTDHLSGVLDDATLVSGPTADGGLTVTPGAGDTFVINGTVPTGESRTVTYTVRVDAFADQGDHNLGNVLDCQAGEPADCAPETTEHPVRSLRVTKSSDATADARPGDTVTYTVSIENIGTGDYPATEPATLVDDLTGVLDDADYQDDATSDVGDDPTYAAPRLRWAGALGAGEIATITYTVVLGGGGDGHVDNVAWAPDPGDPDGPTPVCNAAATVPCDGEEFDLPKLSITKTAGPTEVSAVGDIVTYTVTVTNEGPGDYSASDPARFSDDLRGVLDDATYVAGSETATVGTATFTDPSLSWEGALPAGDAATITYQVRYTGAGDRALVNEACVPDAEAADPAETCDAVTVGGPHLAQSKTSDPADGATVGVGDEISYTLTFTNDGGAPALVDTTDDLSDVLDDGELVGTPVAQDGLTATQAGDSLAITGFVPVGETRTVTYTVRVTAPDTGDGVLRNALACQPGDPPTCDPETTEHPVRQLEVTKTSTADADTRQGDTVTYTLTVENIGGGDYTAADPARVVDDLTAVLDDADYNDDASADVPADPAYAEPRVTWEGALQARETVTITYSVTLTAGGDGVVRNVAWAPDPGDPGPTPDCDDPDTAVPCDGVEYEVPRLSITKTADRTELPAVGETMTYTVVVTNEGPGDYTAGAPASFADDLTEVLDDASYVVGSATADIGNASFTSPNLSWSGVLASGEDATITYQIMYNGNGDQQLDNSACVPADEALDPALACEVVRVPGSDLVLTKTSDPADGASVDVGDEITYTLSFTNDGLAPATVDTTDDLSDVLDDAELVGAPIAEAGLTATPTSTAIVVTGLVPPGETLTVTYTVRVTLPAGGDGVLRNALACNAGAPLPCDPETTEHPVRRLEITKASDASADTRQGDAVTYTVTAENVGTGDYGAGEPAVVVDDLTDVLDDAVYNDDADADLGDDPSYAEPRVRWEGPLASGEKVTITYSVTLKGGGDGAVRNVAWAPDPGEPPGPPPDCDDPATTVPCDGVEIDLPRLSLDKTASSTELPAVGGELTYTVVVRNEGPGDYTANDPATFSDDLTEVLDDATFVAGSESADVGDVSFADPTLSWSGVLASGEDATVTYRVKYTGDGDQQLRNAACVPVEQALDPTLDCDTVTVPGADLTQTKTSDPADGASVDVGDEITYTLTFTNDGEAAATVDTTDDLSGVLDDAELVDGPNAQADLTADRVGDGLDITGSVPAGETRTVTYSVRVLPFADQDDHVLRNALACQAGEPVPCAPATTSHPVRRLQVTKTSDMTADTRQGDTVTYTVTAQNIGGGDYGAGEPAVVVDDLTGVLDDADYNDDAAADLGDVPTYAEPRVRWEGPLAGGETVTITYTVTLKGGGDGVVRNVAWAPDPGEPPGPPPDCDDPATTVPCDGVEHELPRLSIVKSADRTELPAVGETMRYTVVVTNEGPGDYTGAEPAEFSDDLSKVLDDATFVDGSITTTAGAASFADPTLSWSGVLPPGDAATVTYLVRYTGAGDHQLDNAACVPEEQAVDPACITVRVPGSGLEQTKSSDPADGSTVGVGDELTYTLTFTNTGPAAATVDTTDDLADVLDDADLVTGPTAEAGLDAVRNGDVLEITGTVPTNESLTVTYTVRVKALADQGDHVLANTLACQPGDPPTCEPETTEHPVRGLEITKTSDATADARPGDMITYTVVAENTGAGDYTDAAPATVTDDLTAVLDDADYNGDAAGDLGDEPTYVEPRVTWSGALAAGGTVTITYSVTLTGGGDGDVSNVVWGTDPGDPPGSTPDCDDPTTTVPCDEEQFDLPKLSIVKDADPDQVTALGDVVTFTVTVTNDGPGDYTAAAPATFSDDLSAVLDDATYVAGSETADVGTASFGSPTLSWTGVLAAGDEATITYQVRYTGAGNKSLVNAACVPEDEATDPAEDCATVTVPGAGLSQTKTANPASGTTVGAGDRVTYTLTFANTGSAPAKVDTTDDLTGVLDDATLVAGPTAESGLTAVRDGNRIRVNGSVPAGQTRTVTYTVEVEPFADQGDHVLRNALACQPGEPAACEPETTEHPIGHLTVTKTSDATAGVDTGDTVKYTITVRNDGATVFDPAVVHDDLSDVLDDATGSGVHADKGTATFEAPNLVWEGRLEPGETATITYSVTVTNEGDHDLGNVASVPGCDDPGCNPPPVITDLPYVVPDKTTDPPSGESVQAGDEVTYTLSWTNNGKAPGVVDATDDLSDVLDDAELVAGPTSSSPDVTATRDGDTLRIVGPIDPGETVTVTYKVRIKPDGRRGDNVAGNVLTPDTPQVDCDEDDECEPVDPPVTENPIGELDDDKSVDPGSGSTVSPGDELTYSLTFTNTGTGDLDVDREDDLSGVLDDATLVSGPTSSDPALTVSGPGGDGRIRIKGTIEPGQTVTITYTVRVMQDGGDDALANFLVDPGVDPPPSCRATDDCTENPESDVDATKDVDLPHASQVSPGDVLTYTLQFVNRGSASEQVDHVDDITDVLDDAAWDRGPDSSDPALKAERNGTRLRITGTLEPGQVVRVTYAVRVKADGQRGNSLLDNYLFPEGDVSPNTCLQDTDLCTTNAVSPNVDTPNPPPGANPNDLPGTGARFGPALIVAALLCLLLGIGLVMASRRRGDGEGDEQEAV